ncbi:hypothetical protein DL769_000887 [Monosporascus sp. CRB-8-3]|nr:hypothetical protein DL769_000887 [Monosporascus sp. CRB-8-3]
MIGPLPVTCNTTIREFDYPYNGGMGGAVPFNGRYYGGKRTTASDPLLVSVMSNITNIKSELLGGVWTIVTNTRFFNTVDELRAAYKAGELKEDYYQLEDDSWAMMNYNPGMGVRELEEKFAPQCIEVGGKQVQTGLGAQEELILYELSTQEVAGQYGGFQPNVVTILFHDTYYSLGEQDHGQPKRHLHLRVLHQVPPLQAPRRRRPEDYGFQSFDVGEVSLLTLRPVATIGNYDYIFDYAFHVDSSLEVTPAGLGAAGGADDATVVAGLGTFEKLELDIRGMKEEQHIVPSRSNIHLGTLRSPFSLRNSAFAKSHLAVTRHHDTEPWVNSVQNLNVPRRPQQDFARFFDGENVDGEDIVIWFNLGMHNFRHVEVDLR